MEERKKGVLFGGFGIVEGGMFSGLDFETCKCSPETWGKGRRGLRGSTHKGVPHTTLC